MSGDRDAIRLEHSIKIFNNIENSNFFVMPGATHFGSYQKPELFNLVLLDFLNNPFSKLSTVDIMTGKLTAPSSQVSRAGQPGMKVAWTMSILETSLQILTDILKLRRSRVCWWNNFYFILLIQQLQSFFYCPFQLGINSL